MENDVFFSLMKMISALAIVLGVMLLVYVLVRKTVLRGSGMAGGGRLIQILAHQPLAPKKSLVVVRVAGEFLVLGLSGEGISMLDKLDSAEFPQETSVGSETPAGTSFAGILGTITGSFGRQGRKRS